MTNAHRAPSGPASRTVLPPPLPFALTAERTTFVGRTPELAHLRAVWGRVHAGQALVVLLAGEPGIGKTRLALEFGRAAHTAGATLLLGRCDAEAVVPFQPFVEALRHYITVCPPDLLAAQVASCGPGADAALVRFLPALSQRLPVSAESALPTTDPEGQRYRLFDAVASLLAAAARVHPVVLVLDDLHWADKPTLLLLRHLLRAAPAVPLLVLGTYRSTDLDSAHPLAALLADLTREPHTVRVVVGGLSLEEAATLIAGIAGVPAAPAVVTAVYQETEGTPFFLEQVVRQLLAEGRDLTDPQASVQEWQIPEGVRQVVGLRLSRLTDDCRRTLTLVATMPGGASWEVLAAVSPLDEERLLDVLDEALRAQVLRERTASERGSARYEFTHALIRQSLYDELSTPRRVRLHRQVGEALERVYAGDIGPHLPALAHHFVRAAPLAAAPRAIAYARQAGELALTALAYEDAATYFAWALHLTEPGTPLQRCGLLLALGDARMKAGDRPQASATFTEAAALARTLCAPDLLARAALGLGGLRPDYGFVNDLLIERLKEALHALGTVEQGHAGAAPEPEHRALHARVLARLALELRQAEQQSGSTAFSDAAVAAAQQAGDYVALTFALRAKHAALWVPERLEARGPVTRAIMDLATETGDRELIWHSHLIALEDHLEWGDMAAADSALDAAARLAEELRQPSVRWRTLVYQAMRALLAGRFDECEQLAGEALAFGQRMQSESARRAFSSQLFALRREQGRLAEWEADVRIAVTQDDRAHIPNRLQCRDAMLLCELGRVAETRRVFDELAAEDFADPGRSADGLFTLSLLAEACAALGDTRRAARLYDLLLPYAERIPPVRPTLCVCLGSVARPLGLLATTMGRWDAAATHFEAARTMHTRMGARPLLAHTHRAYGALLLARRRHSDRSRARDLLEDAVAIYDELGMTHHATRTRTLLAAPGLAARTAAVPAYPDGLSQREVEVLRLIAAGKSNREIAEWLVISLNTVLHHVSNIFNKTGAANRAEAVTYAHHHELVE